MGAGLPADIRRAQLGPVPCSVALARRDKALDEVGAAIPGDAERRQERKAHREARLRADPV